MGNTPGKPHPRPRNKKYLQFKGTDRPTPPGKPYLATEAESTPDVLTIRWDTPSKNGGTPLTGYLVEHRRTGSPHWVRATPLMVKVPELTLSGLEPGWRYQFRIFAENLVGLSDPSELSEPLTVTLQRSAITAPRFTQELKDSVALENEKVEFVVHYMGQPTPKLCWFKDGIEIFSSRRTRILTEHDRSILTIHQSAICDEGEIKCTAINKAGHVSTKAQLTLEAPPCIRLPRQYEDGLLFEIGELIRLKVSVAGLPSPLIFWTHNGESINENERYEIENDDKMSTLRISEALRSDRGEYQIKAINKLGTDIASFLVTVTDKPSPPGKAKVVMTLGRSATISWNTPEDDGGCKIGNYIIEYYRLGWNVWLKAATSRQLTTILGDLIEGSEYKFRVKAESPFGVSEPSEETELIFIPDPKRGILEPTGSRSRSQPRDIMDSVGPIAAKRKKPRSQSSSRAGENEEEIITTTPTRPQRIKSPPKTPEQLSPRPERKDLNILINRSMFDRESMSRELTYGSPNIKIKKTDVPIPKEIAEVKPTPHKPPNQSLQESIRSTIPVIDKQQVKSKVKSPIQSRSPSPNPFVEKERSPNDKDRSPNSKEISSGTNNQLHKFSRKNSENLGGSTEFMMVLYPSENNRDMCSTSEFGFDLENNMSIAPPLSLSAPELGAEPPTFEALRLSASSTELLHERAMVRFYNEALAEEAAMKRKLDKIDDEGKSNLIPKIQINNKDNQNIVGLERKHSLRRRLSAGGAVPQQILMAQKRQSWRNSNEFSDLFDSKVPKRALTIEEKREIMQSRQRSQSEEKEEEEFERVRARMNELRRQQKKNITVAQEKIWEPEEEIYEESLSEEESSDESYKHEPKIKEILPEEEDETYHPRMISTQNKALYEEPFEILTKPAKLPDANFVPKPILKKKDTKSASKTQNVEPKLLKEYNIQKPTIGQLVSKRGSLPDVPIIQPKENKHDTSAVASVAGITAASVVIPQPLLHKREAEEAKVVIEHYGDIVRSYGQRRTSQTDNNPIREALRKAAALQAALHQSDEEEEEKGKEISTAYVSNNSKINAMEERFKSLEKKLEINNEPPPRSATPIFKQNVIENKNAELFSKRENENQTKVIPIRENNIENKIDENKRVDAQQEAPMLRRGREETRYVKRNVTQSKSPHRLASESRKPRKSSPSPVVAEKPSRSNSKPRPIRNPNSRSNSAARNQSRSNSAARPPPNLQRKSKSPSPTPMFLRKPKMCEIMTQTSTSIDPFPPRRDSQVLPIDEKLKEITEIRVRTAVDYITDLAMFAVACWLFLFSNELLALPFLLVTVYRQLKDEVKKRIPLWIKRRWNKQKKH